MKLENSQLLRFTTAGSVDDGKSTLIGRLLYDSKSIFEDQLEAVAHTSRQKGFDGVDLALFTDGLRDEREQGITIDVAYRYFTTPRRKFIIADTPGHIQFTRNMVTGASTADAAIILADARHGVVEQTKRHAYIASLLHIPHVLVCVNKMDLVDFRESVFQEITVQFEEFASKMQIPDIRYIPISALLGDNVVNPSENMPWFAAPPLLHTLETLPVHNNLNHEAARLPVQTVLRPQSRAHIDYRGYAGRVAGGVFRVGDPVTILPSGFTSQIRGIDGPGGPLLEASAPMSVAMTLEDDIDISRGDMIVRSDRQPEATQELEVMMCWLNNRPAQPRARYTLMHTTNQQKAMIREVVYKVDIETLNRNTDDKQLNMNDICLARIRTNQPLMVDSYRENRATGSLILIDDTTNETVAAGMVV